MEIVKLERSIPISGSVIRLIGVILWPSRKFNYFNELRMHFSLEIEYYSYS